ncbi:PemK family transcriptional regulator [Frateuria sp. Soil773]|uniref:type II toxin-antitoxin system PemK/MazF family toxin n=1 Tax=Frateuria sp. Soil773 TaxID=1736407 RepID=UPI0006F4AC79|nr:type II toxin-antitoxin system PemK/MazF family toxin [Frateuria sp. Soil773]KRE90932.1 PemK family transcriptional regulator [Frateuria sp. Soil773]
MDRTEDPRLIAYTGEVAQGDVYWIAADETRGSVPGYPHPHVVVQDDVFNRSRIATVVVCALTSDLRRTAEPGNVLLEPGEGGLERQSVIVVSQVSSLYKARLGKRIGTLSHARIEQALAGLRFQQASFFNR